MDEKLRLVLDRFSQQDKIVAVVDGELFFRDFGVVKMEEFGITAKGFSSLPELETADTNIGAVLLGLPTLNNLEVIEPALNIAVKRRTPLVVTTTSGLTPQSIEKAILAKGGVSLDKVPTEFVSGRRYDMIVEAIAQGLYELTDEIKNSSGYRRFSLEAPTEY